MSASNQGCALQTEHDEPLRVMALHALEYCPRLFYLEEVEETRLADDRVFSGRALHEAMAADDPTGRVREVEVSAEKLGLTGKIDYISRRNKEIVPYEHKRGRARQINGIPYAWDPDALQTAAYAMMLEESLNIVVKEGRVRYHADNVTVSIPIDETIRQRVLSAIAEGKRLRNSTVRPPVTPHEKKCVKCSLAPICLPEEVRAVEEPSRKTLRLFPKNITNATMHIITPGTHIGRAGEAFVVTTPEGQTRNIPVIDVNSFIIEGYSQITAQALQLCASNNIAVHWMDAAGFPVGAFVGGIGPVQRRIRQYKALCDPNVRLRLTQTLVKAKIEQTLRYLLRCARGKKTETSEEDFFEKESGVVADASELDDAINTVRNLLRSVDRTTEIDAVRGLEGAAAKEYFAVLPRLLKSNVPQEMIPQGRSRRPPKDRFNAVLSYLYSLLYSSVLQAELSVGLEPAFGFYHTPRSSTPPLTLDVMEIFRLILCDAPLIGSINRQQWDVKEDFEIANNRVWLSKQGKRKAIELYERRLQDSWKHPVVGYSLSYARLIELEVRLLEKEWSGEEGLFAQFRIR